LGFIGPKEEAEQIKVKLAEFLQGELILEMSPEKTLITHASTKSARFLGYEISCHHSDDQRHEKSRYNGMVTLRAPLDAIEERCSRYTKGDKPIHRPEMEGMDDYSIVVRYQYEYRGYIQYYAYAKNIASLGRLRWVMETSLAKTLAHKHKTSASQIHQKYTRTIPTLVGPRRCIAVELQREGKEPSVVRFGGISLRIKPWAEIRDFKASTFINPRTSVEKRLLADLCELCGSSDRVEVHHIRKVSDLLKKKSRPGPDLEADNVCMQSQDPCHLPRLSLRHPRRKAWETQ
jgi:hypothetical protein